MMQLRRPSEKRFLSLRKGGMMFAAAIVVASCVKEHDPNPDPPPPDPLENPRLDLWTGEDSLIRLGNDAGIYAVSSNNEDVATAELNTDGILITAHEYGNAQVRLESKTSEPFVIEVRSMLIAGDWERVSEHQAYENQLVVEADDASFAAELKQELQEQASRYHGFRFRPYLNTSTGEIDSAKFIQVYPQTQGSDQLPPPRRGTFSFGELTLTLYPLDEDEEVYRVIPYPDRMFLGLRRDLTDHYKALHPDKGIRKVQVTEHIRFRLPPG